MSKKKIEGDQKVGAIGLITQLKETGGWKIIEETLKGNISMIEESILTGKEILNGGIEKDLTHSQTQRLRDRRAVMAEMLNLPDKIIAQDSMSGVEAQSSDPYYRKVEDIEKDIRKTKSA